MIAATVRFGDGVLETLPALLREAGVQRIFLVADPAVPGAAEVLGCLNEAFDTTRFDIPRVLPRVEDAAAALALIEQPVDAFVAIGGGTAIDLAKLVALASTHTAGAAAWSGADPGPAHSHALLVACPTTSGSGSEATHFAVAYENGQKRSVAHPTLRPGLVVLDPVLTWSLPAYQTAATGFDALAQGIESFWSVQATPASQAIAREAIRLAWEYLPKVVRIPTPAGRSAMMRAAHLAGRAIDYTKTTACHALSYDLSYRFQLPHGHAVALTLPGMFTFIDRVNDQDANDPRGADYVRRQIQEVCALLGFRSADSAAQGIAKRMEEVGLASRLSDCGIATEAERMLLARSANPERLRNNPRRLTPDQALDLFDAIA